ncbi:phosphotransferase [Brevibacterium album]|uniref:phosphotransferase n=1 Tax=Brevibacterium album TaxID=417948 RepID=UPI0004186D6C|nr:phosphotransferase [Brevibacterium album]
MSEALRSRLRTRLGDLGAPSAEVTEMRALTGGASRRLWEVRTDAPGEWARFVLRMDHPSSQDPEGNEQEAAALRAAHAAGVPCPRLLDASGDPDVLGAPYLLLTFAEGETIARRVLRDERYAAARSALAAQLGTVLGRIAQVDTEGLELDDTADPVAALLESYAAVGTPRPALLLGLRELARRRPEPAPRRTLVHGDFRLGNLMIDEQGLASVLDWELVHRGDPFEDLGYVCMRAWRFGGAGRVAGVGEADELLDAYETVTGFRPTEAQLLWWEAVATAWWGVGCLRQMQRSAPGHARELELLAIGRRTAEQEHDLLELLYPGVPPAPHPGAGTAVRDGSSAGLRPPARHLAAENAPAPPVPLFTSPTAAQLLAGLGGYLERDLVRGEGEPDRFTARVARNVVGLLEREDALREEADRWHGRALAHLGAADEAELAERIRALPDTGPAHTEVREIVGVLKAAARLRLAASNPGYASADGSGLL